MDDENKAKLPELATAGTIAKHLGIAAHQVHYRAKTGELDQRAWLLTGRARWALYSLSEARGLFRQEGILN